MKVPVTDMRHASVAEERRVLESAGVIVDTTFSENEAELIRIGAGAVGFLVFYARITRKVMEGGPKIPQVSRCGVLRPLP